MREILFRGKRVDNGEWIYGDLTHISNGKVGIWGFDNNQFVLVNPSTVGQYTGLTDKNGKKIFEGDIVKRPKLINDKYIDIKNISISVIDWLVGEAYFTFYPNAECSDDCLSCNYCGSELEIIGNIHDNPALPALLEVE